MAYQMNNNSGSIFVNDKKHTPNQPDFTGRCIINGQTYYISAWKKVSQGQDGQVHNYFSLAFNAPQASAGNPVVAAGAQVYAQQQQQPQYSRPAAPQQTFPQFPQFPTAPAPAPAPQYQAPAPAPQPAPQFDPMSAYNDLPF